MNRQEILNRAVHGLRGQGWEQCNNVRGSCVFYDPETGRRCAWGHVDPEGTQDHVFGIASLLHKKIGVVALLNPDDVVFAIRIQGAHDLSEGPQDMERRCRELAAEHGLTFPEEVGPPP